MTARAALISAVFLSACSGSDAPKVAAPEYYTRAKLLDPKTCNECHQDHYKEWSGSMHAYAAKDPLFRAMNKRGQEETGGKLGNFCVNCHAPMAVAEADGGSETIDPANIPDALSGITCYFCHNVKAVEGTHNNPLVLANDVTMRGGIHNPFPYKAHAAEYSSLHDSEKLESSNLCGACHDIVVPEHFDVPPTVLSDGGITGGVALERTFQEWKGSIFNSTKQGTPCGECHLEPDPRGTMPIATPPNPPPGMPGSRLRHQHDFPAVDTAFSQPAFPGDPDVRAAQLARVQVQLDKALRVVTCVDPRLGNLAITLENMAAGHNFPSGASQDRRLWLEVHVYDEKRGTTYASGVVPPGQSVVAAEAASLSPNVSRWLFRDVTTKEDGSPAHMFWDVRNVESHTIPVATTLNPYNTLITRFAGTATGIALPDRVTVTAWLEPVGRDVIDDLVASGHLAADGPEATSLPRFNLVPKRLTAADAGGPDAVTLDWTRDRAEGPTGTVSEDGECLETSPKPPLPPMR